jgi:high-affinity iron transporter
LVCIFGLGAAALAAAPNEPLTQAGTAGGAGQIAAPAALTAPARQAAPAALPEAGRSWGDIATEMNSILEDAWALYKRGELDAAYQRVDDAYYGHYETDGFEKIVMSFVSGQAATDAEYEFGLIKKAIKAGGPNEDVRSHIDTLKGMLTDQAAALDGTGGEESSQSGWVVLAQSLLIILREGFEAILVLGAIIAYLVKSGNRGKLRIVYAGAGLAVLASGLLALAINAVEALSGANQELTEGITALIAVVMLVWVSNWVLSKSESAAWSGYIKSKMESSLGRGSVFSLAFVAFLAVFREGAEVILMFQPLANQAGDNAHMIWVGLGIGLVLLVGVYLAIRYLSIRLPLRPFFLATSGLLALLALSFAGAGVKELQEAGAVGITPLSGVPTIDLLGVYPSVETLAAQALVLVVMAVLGVSAMASARKAAAGAGAAVLEDTEAEAPEAPAAPEAADDAAITASESSVQSQNTGLTDGPEDLAGEPVLIAVQSTHNSTNQLENN